MVIHHTSDIGGGSISFIDVLDMLKDKHEIIAYYPECSNNNLVKYAEERGHNINSINIPIPLFNYYSGCSGIFSRGFWNGIINLKYRKELENFIKKQNPDIVIVNSSVMVFLGHIIKKCNVKSICYVRETFVEKKNLRTKFMKYMLDNWFDGVIFLSEYDRNFAGLKKAKTKVIRDCINPSEKIIKLREDACKDLNIDHNKFNILYLGGVNWIKGIDLALKSLLYSDDDVNLILAGKIKFDSSKKRSIRKIIRILINSKGLKYEKSVKKLLGKREIRNRVKEIGLCTDISKAYMATDLVIFPSKVPHQARPIFEAGLYKKTIIISNFNQTKEYLIDNFNGRTFLANNYKDLAEKIKNLKFDKELCKRLGENNYRLTIEKHNILIEKLKFNNFINEF